MSRFIKIGLLAISFFGISIRAQAQSEEDRKNNIIQQRIEFIAEQADNENLDYTTMFDLLAFYYEHPLNINEASSDQLLELQLLTPFQALAIETYIKQYGKLTTIYELRNIPDLDATTIQTILPFITVTGPAPRNTFSFKKVKEWSRHEAMVRYSAVLEDQRGFVSEDGEDPAYEGSNARIYARYRVQAGQIFSAGVTAEKDPGEAFGQGSNPNGFDFYSAHLFARNIGIVKAVALGDYQAQFGQGLTYWSGLSFGKTGQGTNVMRFGQGLKPYASANENLFLRGGGVTLGQKHWDATLFYSNKNIDAGVGATDTLSSETTFTSFQQSGLHRTETEIAGEDYLNEQVAGAHISYQREHFQVGVTSVYTQYDRAARRNLRLYNQFYFNDEENVNTGIDFNWMIKGIEFFGEVSHSKNGAVAYLAGAQFKPHPRLELVLLQRNYPKDYQAVYSGAFGENGSNSNERGTYAGATFYVTPRLTFSGYFDRYRFDWLNYRIDSPSEGADWTTQLNYVLNREVSMYVRYREEHKYRNPSSEDSDEVYKPVGTIKRSIRYHIDYDLTPHISLANRFEVSQFEMENSTTERGFLIYQDVKYSFWKDKIALYGRMVLFDIDDYDARIYTYENDVLYYFSVPALQYQGWRAYAMLRWKINRRASFWVKWSRTTYTNQKTVGSGYDQINGPNRNDIRVQLRIRI